MVVYGQLVVGPAGSGKSTYCSGIQSHCASISGRGRRTIHVVNLDPAAENLQYEPFADIREVISVEDVISELELGPNGALVFALEFLLENPEWIHSLFQESLTDGDYILLDCPGQIELYTHYQIMRRLVQLMAEMDVRLCAIYLIDSTFLHTAPKFCGGALSALSAMIQLELPHINLLSKVDLVLQGSVGSVSTKSSASDLQRLVVSMIGVPYQDELQEEDEDIEPDGGALDDELHVRGLSLTDVIERLPVASGEARYRGLNRAVLALLEEYGMVSFFPMDLRNESVIQQLMLQVDTLLQYDEGADVRVHGDEFDEYDEEEKRQRAQIVQDFGFS
mmetsp:Transcript_7264/g.13109  ORF Transcript_7264/g.13109 Transcript_7264/m.13109 type:complete len:335 (+) Transcript_7264:41-1045(+)